MSSSWSRAVAVLAAIGAGAVLAVSTAGQVALAVVVLASLAAGAWWLGERERRRGVLRRLGRAGRRGRGASWAAVEQRAAEVLAASDGERTELERLEPWRSRLVASIHGPALLFSGDERLVVANDAALDLLGIPDPARSDVMLVQALGSAAIASAAREAAALGRPVQVDAEVRGRDLRATASPVAGGLLVIMADHTEHRRVEELRRNFVVNASHELKTPATSIQALTEALQVAIEGSSPRTPALLARLQEESERLVRLVHDLLDLRRLEDPGPLERVPVDLVTLVRQALVDLAPVAAEAEVELVADLPDTARLAGVPEDLHQAIQNLLSNAVRYNQPGGRVDVTLRRDRGDHVLEVRDTGIGIPQRDLQRVFERFYRVDVARSRERGGTGLGLSLVRHAVERHGGRVSVESLLGTGSTFTVHLPIEPRD